MKYKKKQGFTILESIIYIFLSTIILAEGINLFVSEYGTYVKIKNDSIRANEYKNFYINLNNIISEGSLENVVIGNDYIELDKDEYEEKLKKIICVYNGKVVVIYSKDGSILTYNNMLYDVERMKVTKKRNVIYINIYDRSGEEFICCV